jgi:hypothetical protein
MFRESGTMAEKDDDARKKLRGLFGESEDEEEVISPFGEIDAGISPRARLAAAIPRIRRLRGQVSAEGLTPSATRTLLDELVHALEAVNEALHALEEES